MIQFRGYEIKNGVQCAKFEVSAGNAPYGQGLPSDTQWWDRSQLAMQTIRLGKPYFDALVPVLRQWPEMTADDTAVVVDESISHLLYRLPDEVISKLAHDLCNYDGSSFHAKSLVENHCVINEITVPVLFACWPEIKLARDRYDEGTATWTN